jgi:Flp pilus assembly protein TadG
VRRSHSGQALVALLALLSGMLGGFVLLFNTGQVVNDKIRLTNATDAAAYSAAQWQARSLNYQAYLNRAIVANEVAIAQLVSLRSWSRNVDTLTTNIDRVARYVPYLGPPMRTLEQSWDAVDRALATSLPPLERALSVWNADVLARAQAVAHQQAPIAAADLVTQVLVANEPRAELSEATRVLQARNAGVWLHRHTQRYERGGGELRRYTSLLGASRDGFTRARSRDLFDVGIISLARRGGTDLIGEYSWRGLDTLSLHIDYVLDHDEIPLGWGAAEQRRRAVSGSGEHGGSLRRNPAASRRARRALRPEEGYRGVPEIRDVVNPDSTAPRPLVYSVAARLPAESIRTIDRLLMPLGLPTIEGRSEPVAPNPSAGALHAISSAEVYFQRPAARRDGRIEYPSLFNPYWQARLVPVSAVERQLTASFRGLSADPFAVQP